MKKNEGYEPVPDVETPSPDPQDLSPAKERYAEFDAREIDLLSSLDSIIESASLLEYFEFPKVDPDEIKAQGESYFMGILEPTFTALCSACIAIFFEEEAKLQTSLAPMIAYIITIYPYINATVLSISSFLPIQRRLMKKIQPVFIAMDDIQKRAQDRVKDIGDNVDRTIDEKQVQIHEILGPYKPALEKISQREATLKKFKPDIDIPDPSDIDRELDEMQGTVTDKIKEVNQYLDIDRYIPTFLQSRDAFYWRIVAPTLLVMVLLFQLGLTFVTTYDSSDEALDSTSSSSLSDTSGGLRGLRKLDVVTTFETELDTIGEEAEELITDSKTLLRSILISYLVVLVQIGLVFLVSSEKNKTWLVNRSLDTAKDGVSQKLRELGVGTVINDVCGTRMSNVRQKVLKVLKVVKDCENLMGKLDDGSSVMESVTNSGVLESAGSYFFGRLSGKK